MASEIEEWPLNRTCAAFAKQHGFIGAMLVVSDGENVRIGCHGLTFDEAERALCLALYYNTKQGLDAPADKATDAS